jgi:CMP/dCMP kinase
VLKSSIVAIDGPAGAGKSTIARALATRLGFLLVDTGAMYRGLAFAASRSAIALEDGDAVATEGERLLAAGRMRFSGSLAFLDGVDVSAEIRTAEMAIAASVISKVPAVRQVLLELQRQACATGSAVLEGRDIGTVVCPEARVKFFLTAPALIRAQRRFDELVAAGKTVTLESTLADVLARDYQDENRLVAPLKPSVDAVIVDSSERPLEQTVQHMEQIARKEL